MSELQNPHDRFFRESFSRLDVARDFLTEYLPSEVVSTLNLDTLELQKDSFVVYHGRDKWQVSENFSGLFEGPEGVRPYWPNFRYELQDLSQYDKSDVRGNSLLQAALLALMRSFDPALPDVLVEIIMPLAGLADKNLAIEFLRVVVYYVSTTTKGITAEKVSNAVNAAFKDAGGIMGGFVEELIEQGKQQGLQEGLQEGQQQGLRNSILDLLLLRFDASAPSLSSRLEEVNDLELLRQLNRRAATAETLPDFEQYLETLK